MEKMNYQHAVQRLFKTRSFKTPKTNIQRLKTMPKGWMLLKKNGMMIDNRTNEEIEEDHCYYEYIRTQPLIEQMITRFIDNIVLDMKKENCNDEEISAYIEDIFYQEEDDDEYEHDEEDYDEEELSDY